MSSDRCLCSEELRADIIAAATAAGACAADFAAVRTLSDNEHGRLTEWLHRGRHADMAYMERYTDLRRNPATLLDGAKSILSVAFAYRNGSSQRSSLFADYALGDDYHDTIRRRLEPVAQLMESSIEGSATRICVDTAPIRERFWAAEAGIGFIGLNNQLIVDGAGSHVFLAEIIWTASVRPAQPTHTRCCLRCGACLRACPGKALQTGAALDSRRCLSYLTIEQRDDIDESVDMRGLKIYGCDICRDVCPHNTDADAAIIPEFSPRPALMALTAEQVAAMTPQAYADIFRRSAIKRTKLPHLQASAIRNMEK